jgi:hypothetical protein
VPATVGSASEQCLLIGNFIVPDISTAASREMDVMIE